MKISGQRIAQIKCDRDNFDVTLNDKYAQCFYNRIEVMGSKDLATFAPVVGVLVSSACRYPDTKIGVKVDPVHTDFLKNLVDSISKSDQARVKILELKPDEISDNKPLEAKVDLNKLHDYRDNTRMFFACFDDALSLSDVLLSTKLPKSATSFKEIEKTMAKLKMASSELNEKRDAYEMASEQTGTRVGQLITAIDSRRTEEAGVKRLVQAAVSRIAADFLMMKKLLASLVLSHYPLYDMDNTFKKHTGYPATWFFDPSAYYNFTERYKDASDGLIEAVRSEASVVRPLYTWGA